MAQESVAIAGAHNYFAMLNDAGQVVRQIHGLAVDSNGNVNTAALTGTLKIFTDRWMNLDNSVARVDVASGTEAQMNNLFDAAADCAEIANGMNLQYDLFASGSAFNSNSAASTMAKCMGIQEPSSLSWRMTPGQGEIVIEQSAIDFILYDHGIGGGNGGILWPEYDTDSIHNETASIIGISNNNQVTEFA